MLCFFGRRPLTEDGGRFLRQGIEETLVEAVAAHGAASPPLRGFCAELAAALRA
jgi:hypothetical protein